MFKNLASTISGAVVIFAVVAVPANAADEIDPAKVQVCGACHGQNGEPANPAIMPIIWGQQPSYLFKQMHDFRSGDRESPIMSAIAKGVAQEDLRKVANYFAAKPWPAKKAAAAAPAAPPEEKIGVCKACHQPNFEGGAPAPRLAGLSYEYLLAAMNGFADGQRTNNLDMPTLMKALTPADRDQIAHYLSAL
jgi:cytochrome c553